MQIAVGIKSNYLWIRVPLHFFSQNEIPIICLSDDLIDQNLEMLITLRLSAE